MMTPENNPADEQLDAILRDIEIPAELKSQLRMIPTLEDSLDLETDESASNVSLAPVPTTIGKTRLAWPLLILTASLVAVVVGGWVWLNQPEQVTPGIAGQHSIPPTYESTHESDPEIIDRTPVTENLGSTATMLAELDAATLLIENRLRELEINRLHEQLLQRQLSAAGRHSGGLEKREVEAMILALADQAAIPLGGSQSGVAADMEIVIKNYPGSRGALIAREFLQTRNESLERNN